MCLLTVSLRVSGGALDAEDKRLLAALVRKLESEGLTEAEHCTLLAKDGGRGLLETAFVDHTGGFSDDLVGVVRNFLTAM